MRILQISQAYYPFRAAGGPATKVRSIATRLVKRGHQVTVLTANLGLRRRPAGVADLHRSRWGWRSHYDGVETIYLRALGRYRALTFNPDVIPFCAQTLGSYDVVHIYGLYDLLGPVAGHYCARRNIPYVLEPMGMFLPIVRNVRLKKMYRRLVGDRLVSGARYVVATSENESAELINGGVPPERVVIRRNGIEPPATLPEPGRFRRRWAITPDTKIVLFLGRLTSKKNPEMLIEAFARWRAGAGRGISAVLVIAGPHEERAYPRKLAALAERLGIGRATLFTGPVYDDDKWAAYRDADLFVLPSQNENFGNTAAEAAACGTPVILTNECGIAPMITGRAGVVIGISASELEAAIASMLTTENLREKFREGCASVTRELSWDAPIAEMENIYGRCLSAAP